MDANNIGADKQILRSSRETIAAVGCAIILGAVFILDVTLPLGYEVVILNIIAIPVALQGRRVRLVIATGVGAIISTIIASLLKSTGQFKLTPAILLFNRISVLIVLVVMIVICVKILRHLGLLEDLSSTLQITSDDLIKQNQLLRIAGSIGKLGSWTYDLNSDTLTWSDEVREIHGKPSGYFPTLSDSLSDYIPFDQDQLSREIQYCLTTGSPYQRECELITDAGERKTVQTMGEPIYGEKGMIVGIQGAIQDITSQKRANESAKLQQRRFEMVAESIPIIIWTARPDGSIDYFNNILSRYSGVAREELLGIGWQSVVHVDDLENVSQVWSHSISTGENYEIEFRIRSNDGIYRWHLVRAVPERDDQGKITHWWGSATDIENERDARQRANGLAQELDQILQSTTDAICTINSDWQFVYVNHNAERIFSRTTTEIVGKRVDEVFPESIGSDFEQIEKTALRDRTTEHFSGYYEPFGAWLDLDIFPSDQGITIFFRDVTDNRKLAEQLARAQRLESVGLLTGGIAHDFNNLLTVILGGTDFLSDDPNLTEESRQILDLLRHAGERGAELTHSLLAFARRQPLAPQSVDINKLILSMHPILERTLGAGIEIATELDSQLPYVLIDAGQLEHAILNLSINSRDAMPTGGILTFETTLKYIDETFTKINSEVTPGNYVVLTISDNGSGIDPQHIPRLFDPFFTTKRPGEGSGLGLPMVYGFVSQSNGYVTIYSELDHGTTVRLYLPVSEADTPLNSSTSKTLDGPLPRGSGERILLAEDDTLVQQFASEQLKELGYNVTVASSGPEALELADRMDKIDLLFTDVIMVGGLTGKQLAEAILTKYPGTPVLYGSGYTENVILHNGRLDPGVVLLSKPYSRAQLAEKVRIAMYGEKLLP